MKKFVTIGIGCLLIVFVYISFSVLEQQFDSNTEAEKEPHQDETYIEDEEENLKSGNDAREELMYHENLYKGCIDTVNSETMTNSLAEKIDEKLQYNVPELSTAEVEDKYKKKLMNCYSALMLGLEAYQDGNFEKSLDYIEESEDIYEEYRDLYK